VVNVFEPSTFRSRPALAGVVTYGLLLGLKKVVVVDVPGGSVRLDVKCRSEIGPRRPWIKDAFTPAADTVKSYCVAPKPAPVVNVVKFEKPAPATTSNVPISVPSVKPLPVAVLDLAPPWAALSKKIDVVPPVAWNVAVTLPA